MLRIGFFVCLKNSLIIDDFFWGALRSTQDMGIENDTHILCRGCRGSGGNRVVRDIKISYFLSPHFLKVFRFPFSVFRFSRLFFRLQHDIRHNHLLHRDTTVLEGVAVVADMAIGIVVIDEEIVVVGEDITRCEV